MRLESTLAPFLGPCEACGKFNRNYTALAQHFRFREDLPHQALKDQWLSWRKEYRATLRCRKCGDLFEITDKSRKDSKRCPRCEALFRTLPRRAYEALTFELLPDPRRVDLASGSKAGWPVGYDPVIDTTPLKEEAVSILKSGGGLRDLMALGLPHTKARGLAEDFLGGKDEYAAWVRRRQVETVHKNREQARNSSGLEEHFVEQMTRVGIRPCGRNEWLTLVVQGARVRREADIKVPLGRGRKAIVLCDGVAFHGPGCMYESVESKVEDDRATALAMFDLGYTVLRYSGDEIREGYALKHLSEVLVRVEFFTDRVYRNWYPLEEREA
jgi:phage FluMu protein Com